MSKVLITRSKLDGLATTISAKSGATLPLTIDQMDAAVDGIVVGGGVDTSQDTVDAAHLLDGYTAHDSTGTAITGSYTPPTFATQSKSATPTETAQTITPDSGYDGLSSVSVGAISSTYVGSGIDQRDSTDLTASGATVTVPSGYYESQASKAVASGTAGTPTATKGSVSNHSVSVTPSVTNTAGYISGGTKTGTAVSVSASELVSGTYTVDSIGTKDVTNYASASVPSGSASASATKGTVSNHSVSVTPSVTRTAGWVSAGTANGTAVTVSASELVSGSETKTINGTYDVTNLAQVIVDVSGGSGDGYILTTIVPQTTFTPNSSRIYSFASVATGRLYDGESYLVTLDGTQYLTTCGIEWSTNYIIGEDNIFFSATNDHVYPFAIGWMSAQEFEICVLDTQQHTVKVEHIELVSPTVLTTKTITANGTYSAEDDSADGYSSVTVNVSGGGGGNYQAKTNVNPTTSSQTIRPDSGYDALSSVQINAMPSGSAGTPSATKGSVSNHSVSVTPSVTNTTGYITGGTKTGTAVTVSASELVSGSETKTANGTYDVTNLAELVVNVSSGSSKNVQVAQSTSRATSSTYTSVVSLTCSTAGTYDVYWDCFRSSTGGTNGSQLYLGSTAYGTANTSFTNHAQTNHLTGVSISKNQTVAVYARSRGSNYYAYVGTLTIIQTA